MVDRGDGGEISDDTSVLVPLRDWRRKADRIVTFDRRELNTILRVYGVMVGAGEWRDYAIDHLRDQAVFSVFRRTSEVPVFRIVKDPKLARRQGAYSILASSGQVLKRGHDLSRLLNFFDRKLRLVVG